MVVSGIKGGLANQIFQWACGKNLSLKYGIPFYLDVSFYADQTGCTPRKFSLNKFPNLNFDLFNSDKSGFIEIRDSHVFMDLVIQVLIPPILALISTLPKHYGRPIM